MSPLSPKPKPYSIRQLLYGARVRGAQPEVRGSGCDGYIAYNKTVPLLISST
jgi:hypothetical protein